MVVLVVLVVVVVVCTSQCLLSPFSLYPASQLAQTWKLFHKHLLPVAGAPLAHVHVFARQRQSSDRRYPELHALHL